jgi:hypothetical protein
MSTDSWPPPLKEWVAKCLGQMTDANRADASAELRQVISEAFNNKTLWTTDWAGVQLQSLIVKPPSFNTLKRKITESPMTNKKAKKTALKNSVSQPFGSSDEAAKRARAERFQREHDIERQRRNGGSFYSNQASSLTANHQNAHLFNVGMSSRSSSPSIFGNNHDDPEADPNVPNWDKYTIVGTNQDIFKDYLRLTTEPKPDAIRPFAVLQMTLTELKKRWKEKAPYNWICSQFKSLRQDLTVCRVFPLF